jgi:hypothetical protein
LPKSPTHSRAYQLEISTFGLQHLALAWLGSQPRQPA